MPAISVGSVEVDVLPDARGFQGRLRAAIVPPSSAIGDEVGRIIGRQIAANITTAVRDGVTRGGRTAAPAAVRQGQTTGSAFARSFRTRVEAALRDLPDVEINADSSDVDREIAAIRAQLQTLRDAQVGVDIDATEAMARIERLQERLQRLSASDVDVGVRMDVGAASAQLAAFQAQVNRLDGQTARVDVDTRSAAANLSLLTTAALTFGPALIPVLPVVAAGLGSVTAAASAAAVGVGSVALVAVPAFQQISKTLQAQKSAQDAATDATYQGGQASAQAASKASQLESAQAAVASAERNGARQIAQAQSQVSQARRSAADAAAQASQRAQEAARAVEDAEDSLADAQRDARQAQEDLTAARRTASQELEDLNSRLTDSVLSQRDAEIQLEEATAARDAVLKNANATELEKRKAVLAYDQAVERLKDQTTETTRLKDETKAANKAGVEGSQTVKDAQQQVADAQGTVADRTRDLSDAQDEQARTATENARSISDAQARIADAQQGVADAQVQAAEQAASAQRQLEQAQRNTTSGVDQAATAQAKYEAELAKLTPAARDTMDAYTDLKSAFTSWSKSLQPAVMPIFTRALEGLKNSLPGLTPIVLTAADAIKGLQDRASAGFKSPWWKSFKEDLDTSVGPAITGMGVAFGNIFKGMAGIIGAFLPHMDDISGSMEGITKKFADWGAGLKGSPGFERFLSYSADKAPLIADTLGNIGTAFLDIGEALEPLSGPLLQIVGAVASVLSDVATYLPELVLGMYGLFVATKLWALAQLIANGALLAFNLISRAGPWGWVIIGIVAVVLAVVYLYRRFEWFRDGVKAVWSAIQTAAMWLWTVVLQPVFSAIWGALQTVGRWAMWLWNEAINPAFGFIATGAKILLTAIVVIAILPIIAAFKIFAGIALWLWTDGIKPTFEGIAAIAMWLWTSAISPVFTWIGDKAKWLWNSAIKPAWDGIVSAGKWAWEKGIKPVFDSWKRVIKGLGGAFDSAVDAIKTQWDRVKSVSRKPIQFVVDTVYNKGIVGVWNKVADAFGAPPLKTFKFASGGIMPGYTPGKDVHKFYSPTGGGLELSGGEAIMRPEFTRAVGSGFVGVMNRIAKSRGAQGVKAALAPALGGNPATPTDTSLKYAGGGIMQSFADGGIFGWVGSAANKLAGAGSAAWNKIKEGASWLKDTLASSARAGVRNVVDPLLKNFPGMETGWGKMIRKIPDKILDALFGYSKDADKKGAGGIGGPKIQAALKWAKTQDGKPYQWGGNGNPSWDCSGLVSAAESVIRGQKPHRRWATGAFHGQTAPPGWVKNGKSAYRIGITNAGVGHTAGTLGRTNIESRGGDGVIVGKRARGYNDKLFTSWYGFQPGKYDSGGYLQPGLNLAYNGTGRPEPVFTVQQANALTSMAKQPQQPVVVELHPQEGAIGQWVDVRIQQHDQALAQVLNGS